VSRWDYRGAQNKLRKKILGRDVKVAKSRKDLEQEAEYLKNEIKTMQQNLTRLRTSLKARRVELKKVNKQLKALPKEVE